MRKRPVADPEPRSSSQLTVTLTNTAGVVELGPVRLLT
jgi:hypothetical protein